jgi:WD40 repeat protein/serine/threonine protein kinase
MDTASSSSDRDPLERLAAEFLERRRRGEKPSPADYADLHPGLAEQILEFFPALEVMEGLKPAVGDPTGSLDGRVGAAVKPRLDRLGEYRILREVGRGGMGVVYEAVQESLGRRVALKIFPLHGRVDPVQIERFRLESRSAARLHHGHIVPVYGMGEHQGVYYYAMQYIRGHGLDVILEDLRRLRSGEPAPAVAVSDRKEDARSMAVARSLLTGRYIGSSAGPDPAALTATQPGDSHESRPEPHEPNSAVGRRSVLSHSTESSYYRTVARLGIRVAQALAHAHSQGVLHRDIKPSNLLLDAAGHVWVADFGLAKLEGSEGPTHTGDIVGTLRYMAPERFEGWSDRRSDIYGLGATLYELLTLRPPFEETDRARLIERVLHENPAPPRRLDRRIPRDLETIVLKAMAKWQGNRYATAEELAGDLENYLTDRPIVARRSGPLERAWRWCRRNPAAAGLLGASAVAALALVGFAVGLIDNSTIRKSERAAVEARQAEEVERKKAEAAVEREQRLGYIHQIVLAEREWAGNNMPRAEQLLDGCPPERRGWEWRYLKRLCHAEILTLAGHEGEVRQAAFSPDGRRIATGGADRTVKLWDSATGRMIRSFEGKGGRINSIAFSPDGGRLASLGGDSFEAGRLVIWDVQTGATAVDVPAPSGYNSRVAFARDGRRLATASGGLNDRQLVQVRDASSGTVLRTIDVAPTRVLDLAFSPDGLRIAGALGSYELFEIDPRPGQVRVWDAQSGDLLFALPGHDQPLIAVAWSPDGRWIASAGWDQVVKVWDVSTRREVHALRGHRDLVNGLAFSHDGRRLASSSDDASAKIWDAEKGEEILTLRGHRATVNAPAFSPDDRRLVTASDDGTAKIRDAGSRQESLALRGHQGRVTSVDFHPDGRHLLSAGVDRTLKVWDPRTGRMSLDLRGVSRPVWRAVYSPDGRMMASAGGDWTKRDESGEVVVRDAADGRVIRSRKAHRSVAWCVAFSPDGHLLASSGGEASRGPGEILLWDIASGRQSRTIGAVMPFGIHFVAFSPDGRRIASATLDGSVQIWDVESGEPVRTLDHHRSRVYGVAFDHEGTRLVSASEDNTLAIWDLAAETPPLTLVGHTYYVLQGIFSRDGRRLASASVDHSVKVWDAATGEELLTLRGRGGVVSSVAFSPDGQRIASAGLDGVVRVWDATPRSAEGHPVAPPTDPTPALLAPDNER